MASYAITQSTTTWALLFMMVQSSDHVTPLTAASPTVTLSKNGASFGAASGAVTEIANGWYKVAGNATDTNTLGPLVLHATAASGDPTDFIFEIVSYNPQSTGLGLSNVSANVVQINAVSTASVTTVNANQGTTQPLNFTGTAGSALVKSDMVDVAGAAVSTSTAQLGVNVVNVGGTAQTARDLGASVLLSSGTGTGQVSLSSGLVSLSASQTFNVTGNITGNLTGSVGSVTGAVGSVAGNVGGNVTGSVGSVAGAVGSVTGAVGSVTGAVGSVTAAVTVSGTSALTEAYSAPAAGLTLASALYSITQQLGQMSISGTTMTVLKRDQATTAQTYTLDSSTSPTKISQAS